MKFTLVLLIVAAILGVVLSCSDEQWAAYKLKYGKKYPADEDVERKGIYCETLKEIAEHNIEYDAGRSSWAMGENQFTDRRPGEFYTGALLP